MFQMFLVFLLKPLTVGIAVSWVVFNLVHGWSRVPRAPSLLYLLIRMQNSSAYVPLKNCKQFVLIQYPQDLTIFQTKSNLKGLSHTKKG